ncbi:MAG TPA: S8 family serine peptidase, partial [Candidatus Eisenbacteria bacterium]|nr:S8 family serine peptidase [Candidatus Eisenbacteria bacterium]
RRVIRRLLWSCLLSVSFQSSVSVAHAARVAMDPWLNAPSFDVESASPGAARSSSHTVKVFLLGDPDETAVRRAGGRTMTRAGRVHTAEFPRAALSHLSAVPGLDGVMLARPMQLFMDVAIDSIHARSLRALEAGGTWSGHTGAGVIVGIVDSGVDPTHADFRHPDGTSRLLDYWDQSDTSGTPPASGYGSAWSGNDLTALVRAWDPVGHGTHVAGIAVGDGSASQVDSLRYMFAGVAPEAAVVGVAVDLGFDTHILDAVRHVFDAADRAGLPAVVNLSLGSQFGPHDGRTPLEAGLDTLVGPGRIIVAAAGNEGEDRVHAELHVASGGRDSASVFVGPYAPGSGLSFFAVDAFHSALDAFDLTVVTPGGARFGPFGPEDAVMDSLTGEGTLFLDQELYPPEPEKNEIAILLSNDDPGAPDAARALAVPPPAIGEWRLVFADRNAAAGGGEIDLWISLSSIRDIGGNEPYWLRAHDASEEIAAPGTARGVLTVGSFNTKPCWPDS